MLSSEALSKTMRDVASFAFEWNIESPLRMHQRSLGEDGRPAWGVEFSRWVFQSSYRWQEPSVDQLRLTRGMRQLRNIAPREYDVMRRVFSGETTIQIRDWLNDRAIRGGHPERYSLKDTVVLIVSGADKLAVWY